MIFSQKVLLYAAILFTIRNDFVYIMLADFQLGNILLCKKQENRIICRMVELFDKMTLVIWDIIRLA